MSLNLTAPMEEMEYRELEFAHGLYWGLHWGRMADHLDDVGQAREDCVPHMLETVESPAVTRMAVLMYLDLALEYPEAVMAAIRTARDQLHQVEIHQPPREGKITIPGWEPLHERDAA